VLSAQLSELEALHETERSETALSLENLLEVKGQTLLQLQKAGGLFKYLSPAQEDSINRQFESGSFLLEEIVRRSALPPNEKPGQGRNGVKGITTAGQLPVLAGKPAAARRVAAAKKNILWFGIIRSRAGEVAKALTQSLAAFNNQYRTACRGLFPFGIFSRLWRNIRLFFSRPYFSRRDLCYLRNLGAAAGFVLKMAEAPLF